MLNVAEPITLDIGNRNHTTVTTNDESVKVAPYSFLIARELISTISRWRELSNSSSKSRAESRSKMPTNMASKFLKFVYGKCRVDRLLFQNIYWLNKRPYLSLFDLKEKRTRYGGVPTIEADLFDRQDHRARESKVVSLYYHTYLQSLTLIVEQTQKLRYESGCDSPTRLVVWQARGERTDASKIENIKTEQTTIEF